MTQFKVLSDKLAVAEKGKTVDSAALEGCNIAALIEGGHIAEVSGKVAKTEAVDTKEQEK
jgi:hypothetical protein